MPAVVAGFPLVSGSTSAFCFHWGLATRFAWSFASLSDVLFRQGTWSVGLLTSFSPGCCPEFSTFDQACPEVALSSQPGIDRLFFHSFWSTVVGFGVVSRTFRLVHVVGNRASAAFASGCFCASPQSLSVSFHVADFQPLS